VRFVEHRIGDLRIIRLILATNFPLKDETSDNRRSMCPQARHRSCP